MTEQEARNWLRLGEAVQQEFGCTVLFIVDDDGIDQLLSTTRDKKIAATAAESFRDKEL